MNKFLRQLEVLDNFRYRVILAGFKLNLVVQTTCGEVVCKTCEEFKGNPQNSM